jgi:CutA1 divalent ion tolerance protein
MKMERAVFVYTTYPSIVEAEQAGRALVERRLCACVNILPGMVSYYWWQGTIERGDEVVMIIKTRAGPGRGGARRGSPDALLCHAGNSGDSDRERRPRLPRLDRRRDTSCTIAACLLSGA